MDIEELKHQLETDVYIYEYIFPYRVYNAWGKTFQLDFCILAEKRNPHKKVIRFQKRFLGLSKNMIEQGETEPRWVVYKTFNVNPEEDFPSFYGIIQKFKEGKLQEVNDIVQSIDFDTQTKHIVKLIKSLRTYSSKKRRTKQDSIEQTARQEEIVRLSEKVNALNEKNRKLRFQNFKTNISHYRKVVKEIRSNLEKEADNEAYFQRMFFQNKWVFGPWYEDVLPKRMADISNEPDFVLKRFDGFADIVEIEAPGKLLFTNPDKSNKTQPRAVLVQALSQVIDYIDSYNENYQTVFYKNYPTSVENPLNPYKPRGLVIIGRDKKTERNKLRQFNSFLNNVTIITYDEFLGNCGSIIELVSRQRV